MVLADPTVDVAVLETARGGILREGLGFDVCDVGCVLNVTDDHLGVKGIHTVEDLAAVKSVVTESVSRRGLSVLNGDDPLTLRMARHARGRIAYFTLSGPDELSPLLRKHLVEGGLVAAFQPSIRGGDLMLLEGEGRQAVVSAGSIPATLGGMARFNVANALAAVLVARGLGVPVNTIAAGLAEFESSFDANPGRLNIHEVGGVRIILDYAHNPAGLEALRGLLDTLRPSHRCVIGCVSIPGDRRDQDITAVGAAAAGMFDHIVFRERPDGRGRRRGEVLDLMRRGALAQGFHAASMECILDERTAMATALDRARPGDLVVLLPTDVDGVWAQVQAYRPKGAGAATRDRTAHV